MDAPIARIVVDDPRIRRFLSALLREQGIESILKSDSSTRRAPVALSTTHGAVDAPVAGMGAGADDCISKPFEEVALLARIRSLLTVKEYADEWERAEAVFFALAQALEGRDRPAEGHCERLSRYGGALAESLGLPDQDVRAVRRAGVLHDIGKIAVPDRILLKEGPLEANERAIMARHPLVGEAICRSLRSFRRVLPIVRHHHEKLDGSGYPDGLRGEEVPLTVRVLQIVDVFDALTSERPYKEALPCDAGLALLEGEVRRGWWDQRVFVAFKHMVRNGLPSIEAGATVRREAS